MTTDRIIFPAAMALLLLGCTSAGKSNEPELEISPTVSQGINFCQKPVGEKFIWQNFQMRNTGDANLIVTGIMLRGDASCAFRCFREAAMGETAGELYPCPEEEQGETPFEMIIRPGATRVVRIEYTPAQIGETDRAALVIRSNAADIDPGEEQFTTVAIPMCGTGSEADTAIVDDLDAGGPSDEAADAAPEDDAGDDESDEDDATESHLDCGSCGKPLSPGAPDCGRS